MRVVRSDLVPVSTSAFWSAIDAWTVRTHVCQHHLTREQRRPHLINDRISIGEIVESWLALPYAEAVSRISAAGCDVTPFITDAPETVDLLVRELVPRVGGKMRSREFVVLVESRLTAVFLPLPFGLADTYYTTDVDYALVMVPSDDPVKSEEWALELHIPEKYIIVAPTTTTSTPVTPIATGASEEPASQQQQSYSLMWIEQFMFPKIATWSTRSRTRGPDDLPATLTHISAPRYVDKYHSLKAKYAAALMEVWNRVVL